MDSDSVVEIIPETEVSESKSPNGSEQNSDDDLTEEKSNESLNQQRLARLRTVLGVPKSSHRIRDTLARLTRDATNMNNTTE